MLTNACYVDWVCIFHNLHVVHIESVTGIFLFIVTQSEPHMRGEDRSTVILGITNTADLDHRIAPVPFLTENRAAANRYITVTS